MKHSEKKLFEPGDAAGREGRILAAIGDYQSKKGLSVRPSPKKTKKKRKAIPDDGNSRPQSEVEDVQQSRAQLSEAVRGEQGLRCSRCNCAHLPTVEVVPCGKGVKRRRQCRCCGKMKVTIEK